VCRERGASPEALRLASLGSIVLGNLLLLVWFRGGGLGRTHATAVFHALLVGVCVVWALLTGVPGIGARFGLATLPLHWALWVALPAGWAAWRLFVHSQGR
jgi:Ca2+-transporting ATPase